MYFLIERACHFILNVLIEFRVYYPAKPLGEQRRFSSIAHFKVSAKG